MKNRTRKEVHLSGSYTVDVPDIIDDITSLCRKHKISISDMNMVIFAQKNYYAMISSDFFPMDNHIFWNELFKIVGKSKINVRVVNKESV